MPAQENAGAYLNNRVLVVGGALAAVGAAMWTAGGLIAGSALFSAVRQWALSEQRRDLMLKAKTVSNAAATAAASAWKQQAPGTITLPDVAMAEAQRTRG